MFCTFTFDRGLRFRSGLLALNFTASVGVFTWLIFKSFFFVLEALANILKSSLGPQGLDKMLVDDIGDVTITNDGATILKQLEVQIWAEGGCHT